MSAIDVAAAHREWREAGFTTMPVKLVAYTDSKGKRKKRPTFPGGKWETAKTIDLDTAIRQGYRDIAVELIDAVQLDFDPRDGETKPDIRERLVKTVVRWNLDGIQGETGRGFQLICRSPAGEWARNTSPPDLIDEVRCGTENGHGLLCFSWPSYHPVEKCRYTLLSPIRPITELSECPVELLTPLTTDEPSPTRENSRAGIVVRDPGHPGGGDWTTLDIVGLFQTHGLYLRDLGNGKHGVTCPWASLHTTGGDGTDTAIFEAHATKTGFPGFQCQHAHCEQRTFADVREFFGAEAVDRFCAQPFRPPENDRDEPTISPPSQKQADPEPVIPPLAWRTLADIDDSPPGPLVCGMLEPDGPTLIYAPGGTGKGTTGSWLIAECLKLGIRTLIYDAEGHPREWRRRTAGLGVAAGDVVYVEARDLPRELLGSPLHKVVPYLGKIANAADCGLLIIDSILAAANLSEEGLKSDAAAPYMYASALAETGILSVSFGHTPKNNPQGEPYGSVSWTNAMRMCWLGTRAEGDGHRVRWTPRKRNERGELKPWLLTFTYDDSGRPIRVAKDDADLALREWLLSRLEADGPQNVNELAESLVDEDTGREDVTYGIAVDRAKDRIRKVLGRLRRSGDVHKEGGRNGRWMPGPAPGKASHKDRRDIDD